MWAAKLPGEGSCLWEACKAMCEVMGQLGVAIDGGKDSLSMAARVGKETVKAPGTCFGPHSSTQVGPRLIYGAKFRQGCPTVRTVICITHHCLFIVLFSSDLATHMDRGFKHK